MIDKLAGLPTQIRQLEKRLKDMDASKVKPALVKEITDTIKNLKDMLKEKQEKREQRKKDKEQSASEVQKEAITVPSATEIGAVAPNAVNPVEEGQPEATPTTPNNQNASCPLCGGLKFNDQAQYQQHMQFTHGSNVMPTNPVQKLDKTVASTEAAPVQVEAGNKCALCNIEFASWPEYDAHRKEKHGPTPVKSEAETGPQFKLDDVVMPARGSESKGKVMRWDGKPNDLVYIMWESGPLKERDGFGGYYPHDLKADAPVPVEAALPVEEPVCEKCVSMQEKHGDLKTNYEALLKDLQEERDIHYTQGNHSWVTRLDQKIEDLKKAIEEKFSTGFNEANEKQAAGGPRLIRQIHRATSGHGYEATEYDLANGQFKQNIPLKINETGVRMTDPTKSQFEVKYDGMDWRLVAPQEFEQWLAQWKEVNAANTKTGAAENAQELTIMDHTPPRANSGPDTGGKDSHDEFQDEWAMPAGIEMESAKGAPNSLFNHETAPAVAARLNSELNAPYKNATISNLGGRDYASVLLTVSADPKDQWPNGILHNSRYGTFHIDSSGEVEHYSGSFNRLNEPRRNFRKRNVKSIDQLIQVINQHIDAVNADVAATPKQSSLNDSTIKLSVFKRELLATPSKEGYDISHEGKKLFNIKGKDNQPLNQKQLEFCAQIEFTRGMKQAKLIEKIANLEAGSTVFIMAHDKTSKRVKFASLEHGYRGWASASKFAYLVKEGQMMQHKDHVDNTFGHNGKQALVDCPNGSGNMVWVAMGELLPINQPPATPESLNDLESAKGYPATHFTRPESKGRADQFGLIDVEDSDLTPAGLAAKKQEMIEGHDVEASKQCPLCGRDFEDSKSYSDHEKRHKVTGAKECPDCHGTFEGAEGEKCPTCGRFAVQKESLKQALPPQIVNRRTEVNAATNDKLLNEFKSKYETYNGWLFDYEYPGYYVFYSNDGSKNVYFTPDFNEDGVVDIQIMNVDGEYLGGKDVPYKAPLTADSLFEIVKPYLNDDVSEKKADVEEDFDDEEGTGIEPGDLVDFGAYGQLYVVSIAGRSSRVTDLPEERFNPNAPGWYFNITGNEPILEKGSSVEREDIDVEASKKCEQCGKEFTRQSEKNKYCSKECWKASGAVIASLKKNARVVHHKDGWHVLSEKGKNLGGPYDTKGEAVKRLRQVEYFKHQGAVRPFGRKVVAETMTDPYESLTTHVTDMRSRMTQVQEKIQTVPAIKTAGEEDATKLDLPALFEDITHGIALLETKLGGDTKADPTIHKMIEELENKLWKLEQECGITPQLSEEEKAEPEHKEIVEDIEKEAAVVTVTDDTIVNEDPNVIKNVQPTDDDNLSVPVVAPTSPPPPGQKWVFDTQFNKYVAMPDPATGGRVI